MLINVSIELDKKYTISFIRKVLFKSLRQIFGDSCITISCFAEIEE